MFALHHLFVKKMFPCSRLIAFVGWGVAVSLGTQTTAAIANEITDSQPILLAQANPQQTILYVDPKAGDDLNGRGTTDSPVRSITRALQMAMPNSVIQLAEGVYSKDTGETFPIYLKSGVTVQGNPETRGQGFLIRGSGWFLSRSFARQNVAIVAVDRAILTGVTITNPEPQGYGLWAESTSPVVDGNTFTGSTHDGISLVGNSQAKVSNNVFVRNGANGITVYGTSRAEIRENIFEATGFGINVNQQAAPLIIGNRITQNRDGVVVQASAAPILRNNSIEGNERDGLVAIAESHPNLGTANEPGGNFIRNNGQQDVNSASKAEILSFGNEILKVSGKLNATGKPTTNEIASTKAEKEFPAPVAKPSTPVGQPIAATAPKASSAPTKKPVALAGKPTNPVPSRTTDTKTKLAEPETSFPIPAALSAQPTPTPPMQTIALTSKAKVPTVRLPAATTAQPSFAPPQRPASRRTLPTPPAPVSYRPPEPQAAVPMATQPVSQPAAIAINVPPPERSSEAPVSFAPPQQPAVTAARSSEDLALLPVPEAKPPIGNVGRSNRNVYRGLQPTGSDDSPPVPPNLTALINLRYRVVVPTTDRDEHARVKAVVPDAFRTFVNGRSVIQVGAFSDRAKAEELMQSLSQQGIQVVVEELR